MRMCNQNDWRHDGWEDANEKRCSAIENDREIITLCDTQRRHQERGNTCSAGMRCVAHSQWTTAQIFFRAIRRWLWWRSSSLSSHNNTVVWPLCMVWFGITAKILASRRFNGQREGRTEPTSDGVAYNIASNQASSRKKNGKKTRKPSRNDIVITLCIYHQLSQCLSSMLPYERTRTFDVIHSIQLPPVWSSSNFLII